jgi:pimeloyl-ACP methyl ester carboxylesterase
VSFPGQFVDTSAGRVFVHRAGKGPALVLLHGFMMSHWIFRPVLPALAQKREVIAIDLPGFGESDKPPPDRYNYDGPAFAATVAEVMEKLGVVRADVLGHSMGGTTALTLAARHAEKVARLVLVCPAIYPLPLYPEHKLMLTRLGPYLWKYVMAKAQMAKSWRGRHVRDPRVITDEIVDHVWTRLVRAGGREAAYAAAVALAKLSNNTADPGRVRAPTLLLWPDEDRVVPLPHGKRLVRAIPGAELRVIPACGHDAFIERPDLLLREIESFLARALERTELAS